MTLAVKTRYDTHQQTAERIYASIQIGYGIYATGRPYPIARWADMKRDRRVRLLQQAAAFERLGEATPPLPLPERLYLAVWGVFVRGDWARDFAEAKPWLRELWTEIAAAYTALDRERDAL
jgi:hypothetical protein